MSTEKKERRRRWQPKVRTGCITCKVRRVRCDEQRPSCHRCTSTGRKCDGFEYEASIKSSESPPARSSDDEHRMVKAPVQGMSEFPATSSQELHCFEFFCSITGPSFIGSFDQDFWVETIPRAAQTSPAIWHALTSLGALHQRYIAGNKSHLPEDLSDSQMEFAVREFNKSVTHLVSPQEKKIRTSAVEKNIALTVCILFTAICNLQGLQKQAFVHLRGGLQLLEELRLEPESTETNLVPTKMLQAIFTSLDTQARAILDGESLRTWNFEPADVSLDSSLTELSTNLVQLSIEAQTLYNNVIRSLQLLKEMDPSPEFAAALVARRRNYLAYLDTLDLAFAKLGSTNGASDSSFIRLSALTEMDLILGRMLLTLGHPKEDTMWDEFVPSFARLFELCRQILHLEQLHVPSSNPIFSPSSSTIQTLWLLAARCRDPGLRRQAIALLYQFPRREGIWDSFVVAQVAERHVALEEANSGWVDGWEGKGPSDVPSEARMRDVTVAYITDRKAKVIFRTHGDWNSGARGTEIDLRW